MVDTLMCEGAEGVSFNKFTSRIEVVIKDLL